MISVLKMGIFGLGKNEKTTKTEDSNEEKPREKVEIPEVSYQHTPEFMREVVTPASNESYRLRTQQRNLELEIANTKRMLEIEQMKADLKDLKSGLGRGEGEELTNWEGMLMKILEPVLLSKFAKANPMQEPPQQPPQPPQQPPQQQQPQEQEQEIVSRFTDDQIRAMIPTLLTPEQRAKMKQLTEDEVVQIHQILQETNI